MLIKIKNDVIQFSEVIVVNCNDTDKTIVIIFKHGATLIFGKEFRQGMVPRDRVITDEEYRTVKDWVLINQKVEVVV